MCAKQAHIGQDTHTHVMNKQSFRASINAWMDKCFEKTAQICE